MNRMKQRFLGLKLNVKFTIIILFFVLLPIVALSAWLFKNMEDNVIKEKQNAVTYKISKDYDQILKNIDSINMSTQFFISDQTLNDYLIGIREGESYSIETLMEIYNKDIASLERMVNNNPYLYQIRVYVESNTMQEMMPILYRKTRMDKLSWAHDVNLNGWKYNYVDTIFESFVLNQNKKIMSLVTPIEAYGLGQIATLEVAMEMETMFPSLYDTTDTEWSCFVDSDGNYYLGDGEESEESYELIGQIIKSHIANPKDSQVYLMKLDKRFVVVGYQWIKELSGILISMDDISSDVGSIYNQRSWFIFAAILVIAILVVCINSVVKGVLKRFYEILHSIREVQKGDLNVVIENCGSDEMGELGNQINKMLSSIKQLTYDNFKHELLVKNTQIRALQNQINAHFIYNVLESIKMMAEIEEKYNISDAITTLGKLLRYSMKWSSNLVTVMDEMEYVRNYMTLINLRFDYEIYLSVNIPPEILTQKIPKMSLQPIVENAIYHGIEQMAEDTNIYIKGFVEKEDCIIEITDAGKGMSEEEVDRLLKKISGEIETSGGSGNGIGLKNVQDRIKMNFGDKYGIEIASKLECFTKIKVRIPMQEEIDYLN